MGNHSLRFLWRNLEAKTPMPQEWNGLYEKLVKRNLASGTPEIYEKANNFLPGIKELVLRNYDSEKIHKLVNFLISEPQLGGAQLWCFSENIIRKPLGTGSQIYPPSGGLIAKEQDDLVLS